MLAGMPCPCSGFVSKISYVICATVWGLRWCNLASEMKYNKNHRQQQVREGPPTCLPAFGVRDVNDEMLRLRYFGCGAMLL